MIELGSGTGIAGLVAASLGASVVLTDKAELVPLLQRNAELNAPNCGSVSVEALDWTNIPTDAETFKQKFDFIIGADITYSQEFGALLLPVLKLLSKPTTQILIAHKDRGMTRQFVGLQVGIPCLPMLSVGAEVSEGGAGSMPSDAFPFAEEWSRDFIIESVEPASWPTMHIWKFRPADRLSRSVEEITE